MNYRLESIIWDDVSIPPVSSGDMDLQCSSPQADIRFIEYLNAIVVTLTSSRSIRSNSNLTDYSLWTWDESMTDLAFEGWNRNFLLGNTYNIPERAESIQDSYPDLHPVCSGITKDELFDSRNELRAEEYGCNDNDFWTWNTYQDENCMTFSAYSRLITLGEWVNSPVQYFSQEINSCRSIANTECIGVSHGEIYSITAIPEEDGHVKSTVRTFSYEITIVQEDIPAPPPPPVPPTPPQPPQPPPPPPPSPPLRFRLKVNELCKAIYVLLIVSNFVLSVSI